MAQFEKVWVFSDRADRYPELIAGAETLGGTVCAFVVGTDDCAAKAFALGVSQVYLAPEDESMMFEDYVPTLAKLVGEVGGGAVLLPATVRGRAAAAKLGVALGAAVVNDVSALDADGVAKHMVYGGLATGTEKVSSGVAVYSIAGGTFEPKAADESRGGSAEAVEVVAPAKRMKRIERRPKQGSSVDLARAKRVVSVGRGLKSQGDLCMVKDLAAALEAEVGCSRPIAEGESWLERERYVGVTGVMLKSDVYLALGISGQIQHMVGANGSRTILAVNKDKNAPIFQSADYGIVGDIYKVVPALTAALKK